MDNKIKFFLSIEWEKSVGGYKDDGATSVIETEANDYYIVGYSNSTDGIFKNNKGNFDGYIARLNSKGETEFIKNLGGSDNDFINSVCIDTKNYINLLGHSESINGDLENTNRGHYDIWLSSWNVNITKTNKIKKEYPFILNNNNIISISDEINIEFVHMYDLTGKIHDIQNINDVLDISKLNTGKYFMQYRIGKTNHLFPFTKF